MKGSVNKNKLDMIFSKFIEETGAELSLDQVREYYLNRCKHTTRPATYEFYTDHMNEIVNFLHNQGVVSTLEINNKVIFRFIKYQQDKGLKNNTINKRLCTLKQALNYCVTNELLGSNPLANFKALAKDDVETEIVDMKTIKLVIDYFRDAERSKLLIRQNFIVLTILDTGIRRNELRNLTVTDLDLDNNKIRLKYTKTKKNRTVFISDKTKSVIHEYLDVYKPIKYLFEKDGTLLPADRLQKDMMLLKKKLNFPREVKFSFHKLRHSYASFSLERGATLEYVRKTLGHHNLTITQKYLHLSNIKLQEEHRLTSPVNAL